MSQAPLRLVTLPVSPFSERAKWALDHHRVAYQLVTHEPFLGELRLRRLAGPHVGRATVPLLVTPQETLRDSFDIARYADRVGTSTRLIPPALESDVREWNLLAETTSRSGRVLVVNGMLESPEALDEALPVLPPRWLRPLFRPVTRFGTRWFARKHGATPHDPHEHEAVLRASFQTLRGALARSSPYLLGAFSYADIVMATCLQSVKPVAGPYIPLRPATHANWSRPALAREFEDLLAWRDDLYARHRGI